MNDAPTAGLHYACDIPLAIARAAHAGTSHSPDIRGEQEVDGYVAMMTEDHASLLPLVTDETAAWFAEAWEKHRAGMRDKLMRLLVAKSDIVSTLVAGRSNFPVKRMEKANARADKCAAKYLEFRRHSVNAIRKTLRNSEATTVTPILSGGEDAVKELEDRIQAVTARQEQCKQVNQILRGKAAISAKYDAVAALYGKEAAYEATKPGRTGRPGYPPSAFASIAAELRRLKARLVQVQAAKATPDTYVPGNLGELWDLPAENRIRLRLKTRADRATVKRLKASGFRYAPSFGEGVWSAYRNANSRHVGLVEIGASPNTAMPPPPRSEPEDMKVDPIKASILEIGPDYEWQATKLNPGCMSFAICVLLEDDAGKQYTRTVGVTTMRDRRPYITSVQEFSEFDTITNLLIEQSITEAVEDYFFLRPALTAAAEGQAVRS